MRYTPTPQPASHAQHSQGHLCLPHNVANLKRQVLTLVRRTYFTPPLVVVTPTEHLLACGAQIERVFELCGVAALDVAERGVGLDDADIAQVPQCHEVLCLAETVEPAPTERQRTKVLVDHIQQLLRLGHPATQIHGSFTWLVPGQQGPASLQNGCGKQCLLNIVYILATNIFLCKINIG